MALRSFQFLSYRLVFQLHIPTIYTLRLTLEFSLQPHSALKGPIKQIIASPEVKDIWNASLGTDPKVTYEQTLERGNDAEGDMMRLATSLFIKGYPLNLLHVNGHTAYRPSKVIIDLPMYPWNHETPQPLIVNRATQDYKFASHPRHDLIGSRLPGGNRMQPDLEELSSFGKYVPWIKDHVVCTPSSLISASSSKEEAYCELMSVTLIVDWKCHHRTWRSIPCHGCQRQPSLLKIPR